MHNRRLATVGAALGAGLCTLIAAPLAQGRVYVRDDLASHYLPWRAVYAQSLARGESFLWSPYVFDGFYAHGEGQVGMLHPLHLLLYRLLPLVVAFNLEITLSYVAALAGTYLLLRRLRIQRSAAMCGALVFAFSGFNLLHIVHPNIIEILAHTPWMLLAIDITLRSRDPRRAASAALCAGLLTASQLLLGHPQAFWLSLSIEGLYLVCTVRRARNVARVGSLALAMVLGLVAGSVQLLPTWDVVAGSARAGAADFRTELVPVDIVQFVGPYLSVNRGFGGVFPADYAIYTGAIPIVLLLWLAIHRRELGRRTYLLGPALILGALGFVLALGERGYIYGVEAALPLLRQFRTPTRYIVLLHFGLAVTSAIAFRELFGIVERKRPLSWRSLMPMALLPAASALAVAGFFWLRAQPQLLPQIAAQLGSERDALLGLALVTVATALVVVAARGARWALPAILVFTVADQGYYGLSNVRRPVPPVTLDEFIYGQAPPPGAAADHRVQSDNNGLAMRGLRLAGGYGAFRPITQLDPLDGQRLRLAGVRWVQTRVPWARRKEELSGPNWADHVRPALSTHDVFGGTSSWAEVLDPLPRARLVSREQVSLEPEHDIGSVDVATTALVTGPLGLNGGMPGRVDIVTDAQGHLRLAATAPSRQLLVISESWIRGWEASVDGRPQPVVRVYGDFLGCLLDPGQHDVDFRFRPESLRAGAWLSIIGLVALFGQFGLRLRSRAPTSARPMPSGAEIQDPRSTQT